MKVSHVFGKITLSDFDFVTTITFKRMSLFLMGSPFTLAIVTIRADITLEIAISAGSVGVAGRTLKGGDMSNTEGGREVRAFGTFLLDFLARELVEDLLLTAFAGAGPVRKEALTSSKSIGS